VIGGDSQFSLFRNQFGRRAVGGVRGWGVGGSVAAAFFEGGGRIELKRVGCSVAAACFEGGGRIELKLAMSS
jgi:hypothetical protein